MSEWENDKRWSDRFVPEIKAILGQALIGPAPTEEDQERNTDLIVLTMDRVRIACRVRDHSYLEKYADEFTIRTQRPSGIKTESTKIVEGWGDFFFYGIADKNDERLAVWHLADLKVLRLTLFRMAVSLPAGELPGIPRQNRDGSSKFRAFRWDSFPLEMIIAQSGQPIVEAFD